MTNTHHTPGCSGPEQQWLSAADNNRRIGDRPFHYLRCSRCGLIRLQDPPSNLGDYYPNEYYALRSLDQLTAVAAADTFKIDLVRRHVSSGRLLEIGPAYGIFALQAKLAGFQVDAIEMDSRCCEYLNQIVGINATCSDTPQQAIRGMERHDVIALWQVIEHLPDPWAVLTAAADNLHGGGILVVSAPNPKSWQFAVMGESWPHLDAPRHLYLFPLDLLVEFAATLGLKVVHTSTTDSDAKSWNRFGWQRLLMNRVRNKWLSRIAFVAGYGISLLMAPFEAREPKGSTYTIVFRKNES